MCKERPVISHGAVMVFHRNVSATEINKISTEFEKIFVNGSVKLDQALAVSSQLYVSGSIISEGAFGNESCISAENCLWCYGKIKASQLNVSEYLLCKDIKATSIKVAGDMYIDKGTLYTQTEIDIAGDLCGEGNIITLNGNVEVYGDISLKGIIEPTMYNLHAKTITSKHLKIMGASQVIVGY